MDGQPNQALVPLPRSGKCAAGSTKSTEEKAVNSIDQPPRSTGSREVRRCTVVPQSVSTMSALKPRRRTRSAPTCVMADGARMSVGPIRRISWLV